MTPYKLLQYVWHHRSNQDRRLSATCAMLGWQLRKRTLKSPMILPVFNGLKLQCYPDSFGAGVMVYTSGWPDYDEMHFVRRYLRDGDAFVDVGANIGIFTLLAANCVGKTGHVLALEAGRRAYERLTENIALNQLTAVVDARFEAAGPENGTIRFLQSHDLINRIATNAEQQRGDVRNEEVPCIRLDEHLSVRNFAMGKIDIEGAEPMAFRGAVEALKSGNPPVWLMELKAHLLERFESTPETCSELLASFGYKLAIYDADRKSLEFPRRAWEGHGNVFAIHERSLDDVQARLTAS